MDVRITPHLLSGTVTPPPSKSMAHRLLLAAALAAGESTVKNVALSQDIAATLRCMEALGARWHCLENGTILVTGIGEKQNPFTDLPHFDCGESGSTLRFLTPIALAVAHGGVFTGRGRLMERPQKPYFDLFDEKGISYAQQDGVLTVRGTLTAGEYRLRGDVSSQFFTGLLFALPLLDGASTVVSTTALESADYITMTRDAMARAGVSVAAEDRAFRVERAAYRPFEASVEADWSQSGFWYAAQSLGSDLAVAGMDLSSAQGDRVIASHASRLARSGDQEIDVSGCPDLLPPMAAMAAVRSGTVRFVNAARLRIKESDRLATVTAALRALGAEVYEESDRLTVVGKPSLSGGTVESANDHRIAMMTAIAATRCTAPVTILGADCVKKSYPDFWEVYRSLGGEADVL